MSIRMTGMISGLDTESIIEQLVEAKSTKVNTAKKEQISLQYKQEAWKSLNTKLKSLKSKIGNMQLTSDYAKKTTTTSDDSKVSVITGDEAVNSVQTLKINQLAKTAYLTGAQLNTLDETGNATDEKGSYTALSTLSDLGYTGEGEKLTFSYGDANVELDVTGETTISDVLTSLKEAGLNASFDANNQRFFVSAKNSGKDFNFTLTSSNTDSSNNALATLGLTGTGSTKIEGSDAEIELNGAKFTSNTNVFEINGLTLTAQNTTAADEVVTLTTQMDTDGIYDMIKDFLKEYNEVMNEMTELYNADSASGYEPLLSDEKSSMTDDEIEEWEEKIKSAILRNDDNLNTVASSLRNVMSGGVEVNGKTMYLSSFGIETLGYLNADENEQYAYHIDGDSDDEKTAGNTDKLKSMIASDPDTVISFFSQLSKNLYSKMEDLTKSVKDYRSYGSFYDDKKLSSDYDDYDDKIDELQEEVDEYEDKWYSKFSAMETALSKLQSNSSAVTGLLGG